MYNEEEKAHLESMFRSKGWEVMKDYLSKRKVSIGDTLADQNAGIEEIRIVQGALMEVQFLLDLPKFLSEGVNKNTAEVNLNPWA